MISNIPFGSTYTILNTQNKPYNKFAKFKKYISPKTYEKDMNWAYINGIKRELDSKKTHEITIPDRMDDIIETYCTNNGIRFNKIINKELSCDDILSKIQEPKQEMKTVKVNSEKLKKLSDTQF